VTTISALALSLVREARSLVELVLEAEDAFDHTDSALRRRDALQVARRLLYQAEHGIDAPERVSEIRA
jgi:hypothetical protein